MYKVLVRNVDFGGSENHLSVYFGVLFQNFGRCWGPTNDKLSQVVGTQNHLPNNLSCPVMVETLKHKQLFLHTLGVVWV